MGIILVLLFKQIISCHQPMVAFTRRIRILMEVPNRLQQQVLIIRLPWAILSQVTLLLALFDPSKCQVSQVGNLSRNLFLSFDQQG